MGKEKSNAEERPLSNQARASAEEKGVSSSGFGAGMSIVGHLSEIKSRLTKVILALGISILACSFFAEQIVSAFLHLGSGFNFVYIAPSELVTCYVKVVLLVALVITFPIILMQIWGFVRPALEPGEKRFGMFALLGGTGFFLLGAAFAYGVALPFTIDFFANFDSSGLVGAQISIESYINFVLSMLITFGLIFEMPMLTLFLSQLGVIKPLWLTRTRKYAVLVIFIVGAVITPPDVVSQVLVSVPMILLYEISILICKVIARRKAHKEKEGVATA